MKFHQKTGFPTPTTSLVREIPFASKNNTIELSVTNTAGTSASNVDVEVTNAPAWLMFTTGTSRIGEMAGKEEKIATLAFSVDKYAHVGQELSLT